MDGQNYNSQDRSSIAASCGKKMELYDDDVHNGSVMKSTWNVSFYLRRMYRCQINLKSSRQVYLESSPLT